AGHARQHEVEEHEVRCGPAVGDEGVRAVVDGDDLVPVALQLVDERLAVGLLVLDQEDGGHGSGTAPVVSVGRSCGRGDGGSASGSTRVKVEPAPGLDHSSTSPPWSAATCLT